jgi:hypothetical protein
LRSSKLKEMQDTTFEEGGKLNGTWKGEGKRNTSFQTQKHEKIDFKA